MVVFGRESIRHTWARGALSLVLVSSAFATLPARSATPLPKIGEKAPDFTLKGSDGKTYSLAELVGGQKEKKKKDGAGNIVVLEWFNKDCPYVRKFYDSKTMQLLQKELTGPSKKSDEPGVVWLTIISSAKGKEGYLAPEEAAMVREEKGMSSTALLLDDGGTVGGLYHAKTTPHMFVIDGAGRLAYQGAIDDRPSATVKSLEGAQNYVRAAVVALKKGEKVKNASTTPYGCSVHY